MKNTKKGKLFLEEISKWKSKIEKVYVWDYVINFDNYYDFYPILNTTKENLKSFLEKKVSGVFLQGSGYDNSVLQEVKYETLAKLLYDVNASIEETISKSIKKYYPELQQPLLDYLMLIENNSRENKHKQHIYSGVELAKNRYLDLASLSLLKSKIDAVPETKRLNVLKLGVLFLELEMRRTNSFPSENGFVEFRNGKLEIKKEVSVAIEELKVLLRKTKETIINERGDSFNDYLSQWKYLIKKVTDNPKVIDLSINSKSVLDVDYNDINTLNDNLFGFEDYNNNWLIFNSKKLHVDIETTYETKNSNSYLQFNFLVDKKHKIDIPSKIIFKVGKKEIKEIELIENNKTVRYIKTIKVPFSFKSTQKYTIEIFNDHKAMALDEIKIIDE